MRFVDEILREAAERHGDEPAVVGAASAGGRELSHGALRDAAWHGAWALREAGLVQGDRVLLCLPPGPDWPVAFFGIVAAGMVAVPVPAETPVALLEAVAVMCGARAMVAGEGLDAGAVPGLRRFGAGEWIRAGATAGIRAAPSGRDALAVIAFTSGSTGRPRGVELTHESLLSNLASLKAVRSAGPGDVFLSVLPPSHLFELTAGLLGPVSCGARIVYPGALLPNRLGEAMRRHGVTHVMCVPALMDALHAEVVDDLGKLGAVKGSVADTARCLARKVESGGAGLLETVREAVQEWTGGRVRSFIVGGAAMDPAWWEVARWLGLPLETGYGLTEAGPVVSVSRLVDCPAGSVGRVLPGVEVRLSEAGEVLVRGGGVMRGYLGEVEATRAALRDGWLRTGDVGRVDAGGSLFITGRCKEAMVTAGGETVHPEEVEGHYASRLFRDFCVAGVPGPHGNDVPVLFVVSAAREEAIREEFETLRARAPGRCRVERLVIWPGPLPRTATGKVRRRLLVGELGVAKAMSGRG